MTPAKDSPPPDTAPPPVPQPRQVVLATTSALHTFVYPLGDGDVVITAAGARLSESDAGFIAAAARRAGVELVDVTALTARVDALKVNALTEKD